MNEEGYPKTIPPEGSVDPEAAATRRRYRTRLRWVEGERSYDAGRPDEIPGGVPPAPMPLPDDDRFRR